MADDENDQNEANPVEQLLELMLYAPIGLLYEYPEVVPRLVKRGKSQVQLAKVFGQMAMNQGQNQGQSQGDRAGPLGEVTSVASSIIARIITDIGAQIGLAPPSDPSSNRPAAPSDRDPVAADSSEGVDDVGGEADAETAGRPLPIAGYDSLTARELIPLLDELSEEQRARVRAHEMANRNRKTVLAKLDRLEA